MFIDIPDSSSGIYKIETFEVTEKEAKFQNMRAAFSFSDRGLYIKPGTYKRLLRNQEVIMSNTPAEIAGCDRFIREACRRGGNILINGLGLGVVLQALLGGPTLTVITSITVIEISADVIKLVAPYFTEPRVKIIQGDAFTYKPPKGKRYSAVWHDIWDNICSDNLSAMARLHRKYARKCDWQGSWSKDEATRR